MKMELLWKYNALKRLAPSLEVKHAFYQQYRSMGFEEILGMDFS